MPPALPVVTLDEDLKTGYNPDFDCRIVERNVGPPRHSALQLAAGAHLRSLSGDLNLKAFVEGRLLVDAQTR